MKSRKSGERAALLRAAATFGLVGASCLARPVDTWSPNVTEIITSEVQSFRVDKVDLLFMIDNSASMGDKQALLAEAVPDMITRLESPN